jgi:hypothetical protein
MLVWILFMNTRQKLGLHAQTIGKAIDLDVVPRPMLATPASTLAWWPGGCLLDRGAEAVARSAVPCASQVLPMVLHRVAEAVTRGAARCASNVLARTAQAGAQTNSRGDATLP